MAELIYQTTGYRVEYSEDADETRCAAIQHGLRSYNTLVSPMHRESRTPGAIRPLNLFVYDGDDALVGGLVGNTLWDWLEVTKFWLDERLRGQGHGRRMLLAAEAEARRRGCAHVYLTTFSFQARGFYGKLGYRVVGQLEDYPPGSSYYWLRKDFAGPVE